MDRQPVEAYDASGDGPAIAHEPLLSSQPCRCRDCLFTRRTLRRDSIRPRPPVLPAGQGTYRLASWWSDGGGSGL